MAWRLARAEGLRRPLARIAALPAAPSPEPGQPCAIRGSVPPGGAPVERETTTIAATASPNKKSFILREEEHLGSGEARADSGVRCAAPPARDDVFDLQAVAFEDADQPEWEVLVQQNGHDTWRTAGGK
jgi:hypothetical protein